MKRREFLIIAIATLITIIAWVGFDVYFKRQKATIPPNIQELINPVNPKFDTSNI